MLTIRNPTAYVVAYLLLMVPTYILPYFGSNSTLINAFSSAFGMGPTPQWWAHIWFLTMLSLLGWLRGNAIGKTFLPLFPVLAGIFDIVPGLSVIPLVPTVLHIAGIVLGTMNATVRETTGNVSGEEIAVLRKVKVAAGVATLVAVSGSILFVSTMGRNLKSLTEPEVPSMTKAPAPKRAPTALSNESTAKPIVPQAIAAEAGTSSVAAPQPQTAKPARNPVKPNSTSQRVEAKPAAQERHTVRYINLNDGK
jgi:hypothetical protein